MNRSAAYFQIASTLILASSLPAAIRQPQGIYAVVNVKEYTNEYLKTNPSATPSDIENYFATTVYPGLLGNPAVSGIALYETWAQLNPNPPSDPKPYDWSLVDDLFTAVSNWNSANPSKAPKTVQLVPVPGFNSPAWLLSELKPCDFLFYGVYYPPSGLNTCGTLTFSGFKEGGVVDGSPISEPLPLPWNPTYKKAWQAFLTELDKNYGANPAFVSISVAGPTASSEEMMLPTTKLTTGPQPSGLTPEEMWSIVISYFYTGSSYQNSDKVFIDEWKNAIDMYGKTFSDITLVMTTGDSLPNLTSCKITTSTTCPFTIPTTPIDFTSVCPVADMDCAAETTILAYFNESTVGGVNAKATQTDGMKGSGNDKFNLGVPAVKLISQSTAGFGPTTGRVLGGSQFAMSFSNFPVEEGCTSVFPPPGYADVNSVPVADIPSACLNPANTKTLAALGFTTFNQKTEAPYLISPEQAEWNVFDWFFSGTSMGSFFGTTNGSAPMNYVQIYGPDITYATANASSPAPIVISGSTAKATAQILLVAASDGLGYTAAK